MGMPSPLFQILAKRLVFLALATLATPLLLLGSPLPNTLPLEPIPDRSAALLEGAHRFVGRLEQTIPAQRAAQWRPDPSSPQAYTASLAPHRNTLREILGATDERLPSTLTIAGDPIGTIRPATPIRWPVLDGLNGDGLRIPAPENETSVAIILIPDPDSAPESLIAPDRPASTEHILRDKAEILIPRLLNRDHSFAGNELLGIQTNCSHREWIYRQSFILGRHPVGLEVQKILSLVDALSQRKPAPDIVLAGQGEGAWLALFAAALDTRIHSVLLSGHFGPRENLASEPLDHNLFGLLKTFGDAELAAMIAPRPLIIQPTPLHPSSPRALIKNTRQVAAPGTLAAPTAGASQAEANRAAALTKGLSPAWKPHFIENPTTRPPLHLLHASLGQASTPRTNAPKPDSSTLANRQRETVRDFENYCQARITVTERLRTLASRQAYPSDNLERFQATLEKRRDAFWKNAIGRLDTPLLPLQSRSRLIRETETVALYEVEIDTWKDVPAWGWLCVPKHIPSGEKRPVVVCQHGLEGLPEHLFETDEASNAWRAYKAFALRLAERGFITFAPHNLYRGKDVFRSLQRRLNPLGFTLYSIINAQHQRILEWLGSQPNVDADRIAFYGLSYGGKSAMRTPAVLPNYCLSICSGDFNEWIRKCASITMPMSYVFVGEHEIWEWNLASHANYAEMAALIAPRPFMVERGHRDGVGLDEWVDYEFAKVRRLYNQLGIGDRTTIEHFDGPHTINGKGTFEFLHHHLRFPQPPSRTK
jgi:cephalosporin-C deacetylase-like acetyl esterase